jgi:hypothetical protein
MKQGSRDSYRLWVGVVAACSVVAGCGAVDASRDCVEEFVQEYRQESGSLRLLDLCPDQQINLPAFGPQRTETLRIEYSAGDYFALLTHKEWTVDTRVHDGAPCSWVTPHVIVRRYLSRNGETQSSTTYNGTLLDEDQARERRLMLFGMVPREAPVRGSSEAMSIEPSEFSADCVPDPRAVTHATDKLDVICMPVAPLPKCPSFAVMAPLRGKSTDRELRTFGRTTLFRYGSVGSLVDQKGWKPYP